MIREFLTTYFEVDNLANLSSHKFPRVSTEHWSVLKYIELYFLFEFYI